jgi:ABC-type sugar transport system substrate-binding protein
MFAPAHRLRSILAAAALSWTTPALSGDVKVAFINPMGSPAFWQSVATTMRAAAAELGIDVEIRESDHTRDNAIAIAQDFLAERPRPDYLIATNDLEAGGEVIKLADAAHVKTILLNNDLTEKEEPRTKYRAWLGSIVPDHEDAGYGIATTILTAATNLSNRPIKVLALTGDATTAASDERVRGLKRAIGVMSSLLGPSSVQLVDVRYLDWTAKTTEGYARFHPIRPAH